MTDKELTNENPVAWMYTNAQGKAVIVEGEVKPYDAVIVEGEVKPYDDATPLYTSPQPEKKPWVWLTDDEVSKLIDNEIGFNSCCGWEHEYTRAVEAKIKELNA